MYNSRPTRRWLVAMNAALCVWLGLVVAAITFGALMSTFTGQASELPKWNGVDYLLFCAKEGAMLGAILAMPVAAGVFGITAACTRDVDP